MNRSAFVLPLFWGTCQQRGYIEQEITKKHEDQGKTVHHSVHVDREELVGISRTAGKDIVTSAC